MKIMTADRSALPASPATLPWRVALPLVLLAIAGILAAYWRTAESIVAIWYRSETFAHGFLIVPISVWLIWSRRHQVARIAPTPDWLGLAMIAVLGLAWLVAAAGQVQVIQQYAMVLMIPAAVVAVTGRRVALALLFPLAFLLFGVPCGEALIPPLMEWTADSTVALLRITGIPVLREGLYFTIPSGNWSIVEGCSGVRYLIASITVGALFAYLSYYKPWKRALFVVLSVVVPVLANAGRAYLIVMVAHLSDNKLAHGIDHFIYGWVFFGIVMMLLFWIGSFWRDDAPPTADAPAAAQPAGNAGATGPLVRATAATLALMLPWPLYAAHLDRAVPNGDIAAIDAPAAAQGWTLDPESVTDWRPRYQGTSASVFATYHKGGRDVALYIGYYRQQREGERLVTSTNIMVEQKHPVWSNVGQSLRVEDVGSGTIEIRESRLRSLRQRLLIWDWFRVSGQDLTNPYVAKILLARDKLLGRGDAGAAIIVATPYDEQPDAAAKTLREFAREMRPSIDATLSALATRERVAAR